MCSLAAWRLFESWMPWKWLNNLFYHGKGSAKRTRKRAAIIPTRSRLSRNFEVLGTLLLLFGLSSSPWLGSLSIIFVFCFTFMREHKCSPSLWSNGPDFKKPTPNVPKSICMVANGSSTDMFSLYYCNRCMTICIQYIIFPNIRN